MGASASGGRPTWRRWLIVPFAALAVLALVATPSILLENPRDAVLLEEPSYASGECDVDPPWYWMLAPVGVGVRVTCPLSGCPGEEAAATVRVERELGGWTSEQWYARAACVVAG